MESINRLQRNTGFLAFFFSGVCAISAGVIVSVLQEIYGFDYGMTGTLLSLMSIGNLMAGFAAGVLPGKIGLKKTVIILTTGYFIGYLLMGLTGIMILLMLAFFLVGVAKGSTINVCTILVGDNSKSRTKGMNIMHSCYAFGALLCPFIIALSAYKKKTGSMFVLALFGIFLWVSFVLTPLGKTGKSKEEKTSWGFLKSKKFWSLTGLIFCQNAAETSVTGWMVTYFKANGIISGFFSPYTVTVLWSATLIARMLIAFVFPLKNAYSAMIKMSICCIIFYIALMTANTQLLTIILLFAFAFSMAGMNPTATACAGQMTNVTSIGVMLPTAGLGAIIMPWIIGIVAGSAGIQMGMITNIVPCIGMLLFSLSLKYLSSKE